MPTHIVLFRRDLRLADNPALWNACQQNATIIAVYAHEEDDAPEWAIGSASKVWLHHSLTSLQKSLNDKLVIISGNIQAELDAIVTTHQVDKVFWNRRYEPFLAKKDSELKKYFDAKGVTIYDFQASLLWEPSSITKKDGTSYKVFTPYYTKGCLSQPEPRAPLEHRQQSTFFIRRQRR